MSNQATIACAKSCCRLGEGVRERGRWQKQGRVGRRSAEGSAPDGVVRTYLTLHLELEWDLELQVFDSAGHDVDRDHFVRGGDDGLAAHLVHQRLEHRRFLDARHVKAVDIVPVVNLLVHVLAVFDCGQVQRGLVWKDQAIAV